MAAIVATITYILNENPHPLQQRLFISQKGLFLKVYNVLNIIERL